MQGTNESESASWDCDCDESIASVVAPRAGCHIEIPYTTFFNKYIFDLAQCSGWGEMLHTGLRHGSFFPPRLHRQFASETTVVKVNRTF